MRVTFRHLEYFVAVVNSGTVAGAAESLRVAPSSISAAITHLEEEYRVQLFVRHHAQGLSLTYEGKRFLMESKTLLKQANNLDVVASKLSEEVVGPLDVGCLTHIAPIVMPELCKNFVNTYPATQSQFEFLYGSHEQLMEGLRVADIGIALTYDTGVPSEIAFTPLVELPPYVLLSAENTLAKKKTISLHELEGLPFIQLDIPSVREYALSMFLKEGIKPKISHKSSQYMSVRTLVGNNFGFTFVNLRPKAVRALDGSKLVTIPLVGSVEPLVLGLAMIEHPFLSPSVATFKEFCRENISRKAIPGAIAPE